MTVSVSAFIPARYGSTRLEAKPLKDIKGKPMIERVYERVKNASTVGYVAVATDDERIFLAVTAFGGNAVMTSADCATGTERVACAAEKIDSDIVVNVQGDEPLMEPSLIDSVVRPLLSDPGVLLSTAKVEITDPEEIKNPNVVKVVTDKNGDALYFSRSPIPYQRARSKVFKHIGIYVYRREVLLKLARFPQTPLEIAEGLEQLRALENGYSIRVVETAFNPLSVDTPEDLEKVRKMF